jgi:hypothetical protein
MYIKELLSVLLILVIWGKPLNAQPNCPLFKVEGQQFILLSGYQQGDTIDAYATRQGGRVLNKIPIHSDDPQTELLEGDIQPKFLLCRKKPNHHEVKNSIKFLMGNEFELKDIQWIDHNSLGKSKLKFRCEVLVEGIDIIILKNGSVIQKIPTSLNTSLNEFEYETDSRQASDIYIIRVERNNAFRYQQELHLNTSEKVLVYPTLVSSGFKIVIPDLTPNISYKITDLFGRQLKTAILISSTSWVNIADILPGNYWLFIQMREGIRTFSLQKL